MCSSAAGSPTPQRGVREGLVGQATIVRRVMDRGRQRCEIFGECTDIRNGSSRLTVAAATVFRDAREGFLAEL